MFYSRNIDYGLVELDLPMLVFSYLRNFLIYVPLLCIAFSLRVEPAESKIPAQFQDGDTVIFIGDSITHGGSYHQQLSLFYALRKPNASIRYINAGISGDTAQGTLARFNDDIAIHIKPADTSNTHATIMLGMNDVERGNYTEREPGTPPSSAFLQEQTKVRAQYLANMRLLIKKLAEHKVDVTLFSPSIYDQTLESERPNMYGVNDELALYGEKLNAYAKSEAFGSARINSIDFQAAMLGINHQMQTENPQASIVGPDRIHSGPAGHFVMAYQIIEAHFSDITDDVDKLGPDEHAAAYPVATMHIDAQMDAQSASANFTNCETIEEGNAEVKPVSVSEHELSFSCRLMALPYPIDGDIRPALAYLDFEHKYNRLLLEVDGLKKGDYELLINDVSITSLSAQSLSRSVNLANYETSPFYQHALEIKALNDKRVRIERELRDLLQVKYSMLIHYPKSSYKRPDDLQKVLMQHVEKSAGKPWYNYLKNQAQNYIDKADTAPELSAQALNLNERLNQINEPRIYEFKLRLIK